MFISKTNEINEERATKLREIKRYIPGLPSMSYKPLDGEKNILKKQIQDIKNKIENLQKRKSKENIEKQDIVEMAKEVIRLNGEMHELAKKYMPVLEDRKNDAKKKCKKIQDKYTKELSKYDFVFPKGMTLGKLVQGVRDVIKCERENTEAQRIFKVVSNIAGGYEMRIAKNALEKMLFLLDC